jgi:hypothetical protein
LGQFLQHLAMNLYQLGVDLADFPQVCVTDAGLSWGWLRLGRFLGGVGRGGFPDFGGLLFQAGKLARELTAVNRAK